MAEITTEEVLKIVLAVLGLTVLFILGFSLYGVFTQQTELEQAKINLDSIESIIKNLDEGESATYLLTSPKNWFVVDYNSGKEFSYGSDPVMKGKFLVPSSCKSGNCICFCTYGSSNVKETLIEGRYGPDDDQDYLENYFYSKYFYEETDKLIIPSLGFSQCEKRSVCSDLGNVTIMYKDYFEAGSTMLFGLRVISETAEVFLPWISINQTKELIIRKDKVGKVLILSQ